MNQHERSYAMPETYHSCCEFLSIPSLYSCHSRSCLEGDFQETDPEKLYEIVKRSHNAASLFLTLLANADDYSRRNLEEREVGEKLISAIERYPELDDVICFIKQDEKLVLHQMLLGSQSNEAAMFHTWTALHLLMDVDETG